MSLLDTSNFTRDEVRKRMTERAASIWQMRVRDVDTADPLVGYLLDACAFEFENTAKVIEATRHRIVDRLASVMCPEVIDLPRPAHAILNCRPENPIVDLPQTAQFFHRQFNRSTNEWNQDVLFSPASTTRLIDAEVRYVLSDQSLCQLRGRDRLPIQPRPQFMPFTPYRSVWIGLAVDKEVKSLAGLSFYVDWENEPDAVKASYYRKLQDTNQTSWWLNGQPLPVKTGLHSPTPPSDSELAGYEMPNQQLIQQLDALKQLETDVLSYYNQAFVTLGDLPDKTTFDYSPKAYPEGFTVSDSIVQRHFNEKLVWVELRLRGDFPPAAIVKMDVRVNCFPIMNRRLRDEQQNLQQTINVFPLISPEEFLCIRRVFYTDGNDLYRSSPLRNADEMAENSFMWRPQGVGRFDVRDAREILHYVQQLLREESRAFSALGSGVFMEIIESLNRNVNELKVKLEREASQGFKVGYPYIFIKPRQPNSTVNVCIQFWSTNGAEGNGIRAGAKINLYTETFGLTETNIQLLTDTVGGRNKPDVAEKELILRQTLLTRHRLVTMEDIRAACQTFFGGRLVDSTVHVTVQKGFAEGLIEGAGYVRCLDVVITPQQPDRLSDEEWASECERCRHYLTGQSAMNLPYRVQIRKP
ncbi:type VI secretion system baseplate subunit TssF [Spirosoma sp.]|uniref:type VI secretion system baseplate subunit TssF n=1 Tax=Spirosoma sp. TaxID=1899569 RepID=UPI002628F197|nr:type VI secretion system baseplate subunit TssF [Spirosoma sp.]MCX6216963.1 type VI secretion system baseplate subunit TssF [Spirosoma sp.]